MMKTINKILALAACCLSVASCNDENLLTQERESWQGNDKISLSLTAAPETRAGDSRAVDVTVDEGTGSSYHISDFVIFQFDEYGNRIVDPKYYEYTPDAPDDPGQTIPVVLPTADGVEYTVVVLANYHNKLAPITFADATTLDKLMQKYQKFEKLEDTYRTNSNGTYDLMMNGYATISKSTSQLDVSLFRNVAKLTLTINNPSGSGVTLKTAQLRNVTTKIDYFTHLIEEKAPSLLTEPYPNHNNFTTFDYVADEFAVAQGESEVLTYYLPCHLLGTSQSSSVKTKGVYAPDYATFVEIYGVSEDGSKYSRYRFYLGDNMTNDYNIRPNYHYTLPLTFNKIGNPQNDSRVELVDAIFEEPDANSYIVNPLPGDDQRMYCIPVVWRINTFWQNEMNAGHIASPTAYTIMSDNEWSADIIWQSSDQQMIEFYNSDGTITDKDGRVSPVYYGQQALRFKPKKGAEGNVLVGVYRTDQTNASDPDKREYSWSWHLWITDYNPDECRNQNWDGRYKYAVSGGEVHHYTGTLWDADDAIYHNKWIMDRYLGSFNNEGLGNDVYGLYYRFGSQIPTQKVGYKYYRYDIATNTFKSYSLSNVSQIYERSEIIKYPTIWSASGGLPNTYFIKDNPYYNNIWDDPDWSIELQGGATKKSFFDPCPPGWRIPVYNFISCKASGAYNKGLIVFCDNILNSDYVAFYAPTGGKTSWDVYQWPEWFLCNTATPSGRTLCCAFAISGSSYYEYWGGYSNSGQRSNGKNLRPIQE